MEITTKTFDEAYLELLRALICEGVESTNRKGDKLTELFDQKFKITDPMQCFAFSRQPSLDYLQKEFAFYLSGSDKLEDAVACSKFWEKCSDDGKTINSNYGKLLFHDKNSRGNSQFQHAVNCLKNSLGSKKAVMTIYDKENAYISNDNPCTMFLQARIETKEFVCEKDTSINLEMKLHLTVHMRSSDIYYGLPYDVPFFVFVQCALVEALQEDYPALELGHYTHIAGSLHKYDRNEAALDKCFGVRPPFIGDAINFKIMYARLVQDGIELVQAIGFEHVKGSKFMERAWRVAAHAKCLKKKVGACLTIVNSDGIEREFNAFNGGVDGIPCTHCVRDKNKDYDKGNSPFQDRYYGDECPSVHSEMKCITDAMRSGISDFSKVRIYVTHGPCDACLKFCNHVGIKEVFFDLPYKTDYSHWPEINVTQLCMKSSPNF